MNKLISNVLFYMIIAGLFITTVILPPMFIPDDKPSFMSLLWMIFILVWIRLAYAIATGELTKRGSNKQSISENSKVNNQTITNNGTIHGQQNNAHNQTVNNNTTNNYHSTLTPDDIALLRKYGITNYTPAQSTKSRIDADERLITDKINTITIDKKSVNNTENGNKINDDKIDNSSFYQSRENPTKVIPKEHVIIGKLIQSKVEAKRNEVLALANESPSYIAAVVFNKTGGSSRKQYIAAIEKVLGQE